MSTHSYLFCKINQQLFDLRLKVLSVFSNLVNQTGSITIATPFALLRPVKIWDKANDSSYIKKSEK